MLENIVQTLSWSDLGLLMYLVGGGLALSIDRYILIPLKNRLTRPNG